MKPLLNLLLLCSVSVTAQVHINKPLKRQLDSVMVLDQQYREVAEAILEATDSTLIDSVATALKIAPGEVLPHLMKLQEAVDSTNTVFIEHVFKKYGYPGKALVDTPTNVVAFYVIQHSPKIDKYLPLIRKAGKKKDLPFALVALMEDRYLMQSGKEQIYGTQTMRRPSPGGKMDSFVWPIKDPEGVNARRKKAGFEDTVEQNAERLGIKYRVVKLSEVQ